MATNTLQTTARQYTYQQTHYIRFQVNYNDAGIATGNAKEILPAGAIVLRAYCYITTAFNAATTNVLSIGFEASTYANLVASAQAVAGTPGQKSGTLAGLALAPLTADAAIYALYTQTGTAATAGQAYFVVEYTVANDGLNQ